MQSLRRASLLAACVTAASCGLPSRDNPHDPLNSPVIVANVVDLTAAGGACVSVVPPVPTVVSAASRGQCLAIDVRGTTDHGASADEIEYEIAWLGTGSTMITAVASSAGIGFLGDLRATAPINVIVRFRVTATGPSGSGSKEIPFVFLNGAPRPNAPPLRLLPLHGFRAAPDAPMSVPFRAPLSSDPDGDPITACWDFEDDRECAPAGTAVMRSIDAASSHRETAKLVEDDGDEQSAPSWSRVIVRPPMPWLQPNGSGAYSSVDTLRQLIPQADPKRFIVQAASSKRVFATSSANDQIFVANDDSLTTWTGVSIPPEIYFPYENDVRLALDSSGSNAWAMDMSGDGPSGMFRLRASGSGAQTQLVMDPVIPIPTPTTDATKYDDGDLEVAETRGPRVTVAGDGSAWVAIRVLGEEVGFERPPLGGIVFRAEPGGHVTTVRDEVGVFYDDIAARPGTNEVWATRRSADTVTASLVAFDAMGAELTAIPIPSGFVRGLAFSDKDSMWTWIAQVGLVRIDVSVLENLADLDSAIVQAFPEILKPDWIVPDRRGGGCLVEVSSELVIVETDGTIGVFPQYEYLVPGHDGMLWRAEGLNIRKVFTPDLISQPVSLSPPLQLDEDAIVVGNPATGGVLAATREPRMLLETGASGAVIRYITQVIDSSGALVPVPPIARLEMSPDGSHAVAFAGEELNISGLFDIDLTMEPPQIRHLLQPASVSVGAVVAPRSLLNGGGSWVAGWSDERNEILLLDADGDSQLVATLPPGQTVAFGNAAMGAVYGADDRLCLAAWIPGDSFGDEGLDAYGVSENGIEWTYGLGIPNDNPRTFPRSLRASPDASGPACWVAMTQGGVQLLAFDTNGGLIHSALYGDYSVMPGTIAPMSRDSVWVTMYVNGVGNIPYAQRIDFVPAGLGTSGHFALDPSVAVSLVPFP